MGVVVVIVVDARSGGSFSQSSRILGLDDGVGSEVVAGAVGIVSGGIRIVVGRTCHDSGGRRRHHRGR